MGSLEEIKRDFLLEGLEDYVGLWQFGPRVRHRLGIEDPEEVKSAALKLVRELVGGGLFVPGEPARKEEGWFRPWTLGPEDSVRAIEKLWDDLGREPNQGDSPGTLLVEREPDQGERLVAPWFELTEKGERVAQEYKRGG